MAEVSNIGSTRTIEQIIEEQSKPKASTRNTGELGKDDFLKLLITQVQNQDPLNPTTDTDFIAQMAQFSALEQMQNLNQSFSSSMGFSLMGKYINAEVKDEAGNVKYVSGKVDMVRMNGGKVFAMVGEIEVPVENILEVMDSNTSNTGNVTDYSSIIGMLGKATITNEEGKTNTIEGVISTITKEKNGVYATLDDVEIKPYRLDIGSFENEEEYVNAMSGSEVTLRIRNSSGAEFKVTGILRSGYIGNDGELRLLLDDIKVPANSIFSAKHVDLLSTEQMLLNEILKELRKQNSPTTGETGSNGEAGEATNPVSED
jgi:flagellar basal-body rod modification protein FlgD